MLKVTLHSSSLEAATAFNMLGKLELGYTRLDALADYKAELFVCGLGALPLARIENYPRWSASVWDLVLRLVSLSMNQREEMPDVPSDRRTGAYARQMSAIIEHWADGEATQRARIGTAEITMRPRRCSYTCNLWDDMVGGRVSEVFRHTPEVLQHWDLLCRAIAWTECGAPTVPARPPLMLPASFEHEGKKLIAIGRLKQPARDGLRRWLAKNAIEPLVLDDAPSGTVEEATYTRFLKEAV